MATLAVVLALALAPSSGHAITEDDILFHAPFDGELDAARAEGDAKAFPTGRFEFVEGKVGQGLLCGEDSTALEYRTDGNLMPGEGSIALWVKPVGWTGKDSLFHIWLDTWGAGGRLLFYIYYAEHRNKLYVLGPEKELSHANSGAGNWQDGEWHQMVATWREGELCIYQDGEIDQCVSDNVVLPSGFGETFKVGTNTGWSYITGKADMVLDELTIYKRRLLPDEVAGLFRGERLPKPEPLKVALAPYLQEEELGVEVDARGAMADDLKILVRIEDGGRQVGEPVEAALGEAEAEIIAPLGGVQPGEYTARVSLRSGDEQLAEKSLPFTVPERPIWWKNEIGKEQRALEPWTPVVHGPFTCRVWGRSYDWRKTLLPSSIVSGGEELLAAPISLLWDVRDRFDRPGSSGFQYDLMRDDKKVVATSIEGGGLRAEAQAAVEFDGMAKIDVELTPESNAEPTIVERLVLRIPMRKDIATLYNMHSCPLSGRARAGALTDEEIASGFVPFVWLGNEDRGLSWFCEAPDGWRVADRRKTVRILANADTRELRITIIDQPTEISKPFHLEFGLQATPVKPMPDDWRTRRMAHWPEVFPGNILVAFWSQWSEEPGYPIPKDPDAINRFVDEWKAKGDLFITPYICGTCTGSLSPEFELYGREWEARPIRRASEQTPPRPMQHACPKSGWADFLVWGVDKLMDDTKLDGLYFDITAPPPCRNHHHGCGYLDENGKWQPEYAIFATREMFKRLYAVFQSKGRPLILVNHMSGSLTPCTLAFSDLYLEGEQFSATVKDDYLDVVDLDEFRAQFMGRNHGLVPQFLPSFGRMDFNKLREEDTQQTETVLALTLLHDTTVWAAWSHVDLVYRAWAAQDALPHRDAEFIGYWENGRIVEGAPEQIKISAWLNDGKLLVCLVNMEKESADVRVRLKLEGQYAASDPVWERPVSFDQGMLTCSIDGHSFRLIRLDPK